ncbi:MAG: TonB-dependent receptor [Candidatus Magnetoovum sp. WYHC-5]|nr:TonB-dependent receptor [Candidatus Magnetoovum sp. WYHC-5]
MAETGKAFADDDEEKVLSMMFGEDALVVTPTRYLKPLSQVPENIVVVTAKEIEEMNAHTLAEVLNMVTGLQVDVRLVYGNYSSVKVQGADFRHVKVAIDGVTINDLGNNFARIGDIPVQYIERIEIIKGPASSAWGSALSGVINVITKSVDYSVKAGGMLSVSYGEQDSGDYRGEASGKVGNVGYYLYGGKLTSGGFYRNTKLDARNFFAKAEVDISDRTNLMLELGLVDTKRGAGHDESYDIYINNDYRNVLSKLTLKSSIRKDIDLNLSIRYLRQDQDDTYAMGDDSNLLNQTDMIDKGYGTTGTLAWKGEGHTLVVGGEFDDMELESGVLSSGKEKLEKWALFTNDSIVFGRFSVSPGFRYDHTSTNGTFYSPSIGLTYMIAKDYNVKLFVTRGFTIPSLIDTYGVGVYYLPNPDLEVEKAWSYQVGLETKTLKYVWVGLYLFRHDVTDSVWSTYVPEQGKYYTSNNYDLRYQGFEVEFQTTPIYNFLLKGGYAFVDAKNLSTGTDVSGIGHHSCNVNLEYKKNRFTSVLNAHYIKWRDIYEIYNPSSSMIFNINSNIRLIKKGRFVMNTFFSVHNLFNSAQYYSETYKNEDRWVEGGIKIFY